MKAFYAGSFDPFTNGHLYVVRQAAQIFDEVIVGIGINEEKERRLAAELMRKTIERVLVREKLAKVRVVIYNGLTVQAAEKESAGFLVRGIRNGMDYDYEENLALINQNISGMETIYFRAGETAYVSSSAVMQLQRGGVAIDKWVPAEVAEILRGGEN